MFSLGLYPVITKPIKILNVLATLIANIFTNDIDSDITSGLLIIDISNHLPVLAICKYDGNRCNRSCPARYKHLTSVENVNALKAALNVHSRDTVLSQTY